MLVLAMSDNAKPAARKRENVWLNLGLNVLIPSLIMGKGGAWYAKWALRNTPAELTGEEAALTDPAAIEAALELVRKTQINEIRQDVAAYVLVIALAFPVCYGLYDLARRNKVNFFSILGFVSILISGGVGLLHLDKDWIAVKEAAVPALFGIAVLVSLRSPFPLVRTFLYSPEIFEVPKIESALKERGNEAPFAKLMTTCTLYLVVSFAISAVLNYVLAKYFIRSETGTPEFVEELGKMTFWSYPIIFVPSMAVMILALFRLLHGIQEFTGYELEDILVAGRKDEPKQRDATPQDASVEETSEAASAPGQDALGDEVMDCSTDEGSSPGEGTSPTDGDA